MRDNGSVTDGPLIVQSDKTLLLEVDHEQFEDCRNDIAPFAELERSPEHIHGIDPQTPSSPQVTQPWQLRATIHTRRAPK